MSESSNVKILVDPTTIVLSGGGMHGFNLLGALAYLEDKEYLKNVTTYIGTSIGGMIGYLMLLGYTPIELVIYFQRKNIGNSLGQFNLISMINGEGASSFSPLQTHLEKLTVEKIGQFITMGDLKEKLGKRLVVCTYNISEDRVEYLTPETHPTLPCLTALRMTSNLPFVFEDFKYLGSYYIDGAVADNFPIGQVSEGEKAIGISLETKSKFVKKSEENNFLEYIFHLMLIPINKDFDKKVEDANRAGHNVIRLSKKSFTRIIDFSMNSRDTLDLFSDGYRDAKKFYEPESDD